MEVLMATNQLCDRYWPDSILEAASDLIARMEYDQADQCYEVSINRDGSGILLKADSIFVSLRGLCRADGATCKVLNLLNSHKSKLSQVITLSDENLKINLGLILNYLVAHSCTKCVGGEWLRPFLVQCNFDKEAETTKL